jgi:hypothetical protein
MSRLLGTTYSFLPRHDLPPSERAQPLDVGKVKNGKKSKAKAHSEKGYAIDDTPKSFARLLAFSKSGQGIPPGLDDGKKPEKGVKRKRGDESETTSHLNTTPNAVKNADQSQKGLQIQPGERLSDFARRVDQALPLAGLNTKGKKVDGVKDRQTKHEKRLRRMQAQWREEEARIREKEEEEREEAEETLDEQLASLDRDAREVMMSTGKIGAKKKKRRAGKIGEVQDDDDEDPWNVLKEKRDAPKGIFDVVQAPPRFEKLPREIFKGVKVHDVPKHAGSLRRREELGHTRADIIKSYRAMMAAKRG